MKRESKKQHPELLSDLHRRYAGGVYRLCMRMLFEHGDAEDAVQKTFLRAFRFGHTFRHGDNYLPWLYRIATNICLDTIAKRKRDRLVLMENPESVPHEGPETSTGPHSRVARQRLVDAILDSQDERGRQILILHFVAEMTLEEVAACLNMSRRGVVKRLTKFRANAESMLEELGYNE